MRARNIKPGFFKNEYLISLEPLARILFAGLWCMADREGRLEDRPGKMKFEILPGDNCDIESMLACLQREKFILRYSVNGENYIEIIKFKKHQTPHIREAPSIIPAPDLSEIAQDKHCASTVQTQCEASPRSPDSLIPDSLIPDSNTLALTPKNGSEPADEIFISIPTNKTSSEYPVRESQVKDFEPLYPAVDVRQELREMRAWSLSNSQKRKTCAGMLKFINSWLAREQDKQSRDSTEKNRISPYKPAEPRPEFESASEEERAEVQTALGEFTQKYRTPA